MGISRLLFSCLDHAKLARGNFVHHVFHFAPQFSGGSVNEMGGMWFVCLANVLHSALVSNIKRNYPWFSAVLVPLFGLHNLTSAFMPDGKDWPGVRKSLEMFSALSISFQGSIVAVIFCFMNSEVGSQIEKALAGSEVRNQKTCPTF